MIALRVDLVWLNKPIIGIGVLALLTAILTGCGGLRPQSVAGPATATIEDLRPLPDLVVDPRDQSFLTATTQGLYRSPDQGKTWQRLPVPPSLGRGVFTQVVIAPDNPLLMYAGGWGVGVIRSEDGGQTWQAASSGLPKNEVGALTPHSTVRDTVFAWIKNEGIYRTDDRGVSWKFVHEGPDIANLTLLVHSALEGSMASGWVYAGTPDGIYLSMDCF